MKLYGIVSIFLISFFSLSSKVGAQEQWVQQTFPGIPVTLYSVRFVDANTGWAVGVNGTIIKTTNGGTNWVPQTSGTTDTLRSVFFVNANVGYAVGGSGIPGGMWGDFLRTTNGGATWTLMRQQLDYGLYSVYFTDVDTGYASGFGSTDIFLFKTVNGGTNWIRQTGFIRAAYSLYFLNAKLGYGAGAGVTKTTDGGSTWSMLNTGTTAVSFRSIHFTDSNTGYAVSSTGNIIKTLNGGASWSFQINGTNGGLTAVHFNSSDTGYCVGGTSPLNGIVLKTTSGGSTWIQQTSGVAQTLNSVFFVNGNTGWAVGDGAVILKHINNPVPLLKTTPSISFNLTGKVLRYTLEKQSHIGLKILDGKGAITLKFLDQIDGAGEHFFLLPSNRIPPGMHILDFENDDVDKYLMLNNP